MADTCVASSSSSHPLAPLVPEVKEKPVVVRVKRKASQDRLDAFWLEIKERPFKRALLDFGKLSVSDSAAGGRVEKSETKKLLVHHVKTISSSEATKDVLQSFLPDSTGSKEFNRRNEERKDILKQERDLVRSARFEQIRKIGRVDALRDDVLREICQLYDVARVDHEMHEEVQGPKDTLPEDDEILSSYLPLLREFLPAAAEEIESDLIPSTSKQGEYVYDIYTMGNDLDGDDQVTSAEYPLVHVSDDDCYDDPWQDEYESDDSNAENNPLNDYPDEEPSEEDEHEISEPSDCSEVLGFEFEEETVDRHVSPEEDNIESSDPDDYSEGPGSECEMEIADDSGVDNGDWRWEYR